MPYPIKHFENRHVNAGKTKQKFNPYIPYPDELNTYTTHTCTYKEQTSTSS